MTKYIVLAVCWIVFYALHSFLAHHTTKKIAEAQFESLYKFYRIFFNTTSVLMLTGILFFQFSIEPQFIWSENLLLKFMGGVLLGAGVIIFLMAFKAFNLREFFGLEQLNEQPKVSENPNAGLVKSGLYAYVRHPLYFGFIVMFWGVLLLIPYYSTLIFVLISFIYLPIGVWLEEQKLIREFGEEYIQYRKEVKMLIPFMF
jgi:methanethiol S-methyltransferase